MFYFLFSRAWGDSQVPLLYIFFRGIEKGAHSSFKVEKQIDHRIVLRASDAAFHMRLKRRPKLVSPGWINLYQTPNFIQPTSLPEPSPLSKWREAKVGTPEQSCQNTPGIVQYFDTWHEMEWRTWRFFYAFGSRVCLLVICNSCSNEAKTFHHVFRDKTRQNFLKIFWQPYPGISTSAPPVWKGEGLANSAKISKN